MPQHYPWYEVVEGEELAQGDLLRGCPVIVPPATLRFPPPDDQLPVTIRTFDVVVMTQWCDIVNDKVTDIILCPHWDLAGAAEMDQTLGKASVTKLILKGHWLGYLMLAASELSAVPMGVRIVSFLQIFSLPKAFVRNFAAGQGKRLRLCPPYREHLSQAFARFFMRVGLPQEIKLPG